MSLPWFRMYVDAVDNPKLRLLAFEDRWHYVALCCLMRSGLLDKTDDPVLDRKIAVKLGVMPLELAEIKRRLMEVDLINEQFLPVKWDERQFVSDSSTERVRKHRKSKKKDKVKRGCNVSETPPDTESDTDTDSLPSGEKRRATAKRIPDDFELTEERRSVAEAEQVPAERTFAKFCDYWRAAGGQKARKHDWDATWRNWCRREADSKPSRATARKPSYAEQLAEDMHHAGIK